VARHQPKHLTALEAESEPQSGRPRADDRVNQVLSSLVGGLRVRRVLLDERSGLLMRGEVEGWIGGAKRPKTSDELIARGRSKWSELGQRNAFRLALVAGSLQQVAEFAGSDKGRVGGSTRSSPVRLSADQIGRRHSASPRLQVAAADARQPGGKTADWWCWRRPSTVRSSGQLASRTGAARRVIHDQGRIDEQQGVRLSELLDPRLGWRKPARPTGVGHFAGLIEGDDTGVVRGFDLRSFTPREIDAKEAHRPRIHSVPRTHEGSTEPRQSIAAAPYHCGTGVRHDDVRDGVHGWG